MDKEDRPLYLADSFQDLITEQVDNVDFDKSYKLFHYLSTLNNLVKQSSVYKSEGDAEKAYVYLLRFCVLSLEKLPHHPEYNNVKFKNSIDSLKRQAFDSVKELEPMKERLSKRYKQQQNENDKALQDKLQKEKEKRELEEKRIQEQKEKQLVDQKLKQEMLELQKQERQRQKMEEEDQEGREFIIKKQDIEKKMRQSRFEQQAMLLRQEAEIETRRSTQQQQHDTLVKENIETIVDGGEVKDEIVIDSQTSDQLPPPPTISLNSDDFSFLESKTTNKISSHSGYDNVPSSFLVDPSFAPPPIQSPTAPPAASLPPPRPEVQVDPNHSFGYPSINTLSISDAPVVSTPQPPPPVYKQQPPQQQHFNQQQYSQSPQTPPHYNYQSPPLPLPTMPQYQVPNYVTRSPQYNFSNTPNGGQRLPTYQPINNNNYSAMSPPVIANALPQQPRGQSFLSIAQQQQPPQSVNTRPTTAISPPSTSTPPVTTPKTPNMSEKSNLGSAEASKKYSKLRKMTISGELFGEFMKMAENNTRRSIETCGILSGTLSNDVFTVTTLIIPKQEGTSDTCNTIEEHEIFEYQLENDLLTLGWIHTHPTQDCFLSAVDVHTHCSYQYLLQESIAVVISPMANPNFGIFKLTDPPGMETVQKCKLKSFHPHPPVNGVPIYTKADHCEIVWGKRNGCKVVDMRAKNFNNK